MQRLRRVPLLNITEFFAGIVSVCLLWGCAGDPNLSGARTTPYQLAAAEALSEPDPADMETVANLSPQELEERGDAEYRRNNLPMAVVRYEQALRKSPNRISAHYKKGLALAAGNANTEAIQAFQAVIDRDPGHALAYQGLGRACFLQKEYPKAEKAFKTAVFLNPDLWKSHNFLGIISDYSGRYDAAVTHYLAAVRLKPDEGMLYNNLGVAQTMTGQHDAAVQSFNKARAAGYTHPKLYNNLGMALANAGRYDEALQAFTQSGGAAQAYNNMGCVYLSRGRKGEAIQCFETAIRLNPDFYETAAENLRRAKSAQTAPSPATPALKSPPQTLLKPMEID